MFSEVVCDGMFSFSRLFSFTEDDSMISAEPLAFESSVSLMATNHASDGGFVNGDALDHSMSRDTDSTVEEPENGSSDSDADSLVRACIH